MDIEKHIAVDQVEEILAQFTPVECPLVHRFTPGLYIREVSIPAGTLLTTKIHKTEHPFIVSKGVCDVWYDGKVTRVAAPYCAITKPGTRRIIKVIEDVVWTTIHSNKRNETDILKLERMLIEPHDNPLLSEEIKFINNLNQKQCHSLESQ